MRELVIKDFCYISDGNYSSKYPRSDEFVAEGIPFIRANNLINGTVVFDDLYYISAEKHSELRKGHLEKDDVLITTRGNIGQTAVVPAEFHDANINAQIVLLRPNKNVVIPKYLEYALHSKLVEKQIKGYTTGTALKQLPVGKLEKIKIRIHSKNEQQYIVDILQKIDTLIFLRTQQFAKLDELVKARFVEMFGELNFNENGLDVVSIEDLCTLIKDGTHQTPTYTEDKQSGFKFLSSKDIMTQKICWDDIKYIPSELHEKLYATIQPKRNDILMSKNGVNYGVAAVNDTDEVFDIYVSLALLRPIVEKVNPVYLRCAINSPDTKRQFDSSIKGIGVPNLHLGEIKKTKILLPPMSEQNEFVSFVEQVDKSKFAVQQSLDKLETLKKSLMQKYFG